MDLVEVEITGQAITARYGTLNAGDILRTDKAFADHLVNDCGAAKYPVSKVKKPGAPPVAPETKAKPKAVAAKAAAAPGGAPAEPLPSDPPVVAPVVDPGATGASADVCTDPPAGDKADASS